jgi:hypothetical protein
MKCQREPVMCMGITEYFSDFGGFIFLLVRERSVPIIIYMGTSVYRMLVRRGVCEFKCFYADLKRWLPKCGLSVLFSHVLCLSCCLEDFNISYYIKLHFQTNRRVMFHISQPNRCKNFSSLLLDVYVQLNKFRASSCPSSGAQQLQ